MKITCAISDSVHIAYVYLQPQRASSLEATNNELIHFIHDEELSIPIIRDQSMGDYLEELERTPYTFCQGYSQEYFDTEYGADFDTDGYIIGFEQTLSPNKFLKLIQTKSYQLIETTWRNQQFNIFTMDHEKEIYSTSNVLCSVNSNHDVFLIVELLDSSKLNIYYPEEEIKKIAIIKALVTKNERVYPRSYLSEPEFVLYKDVPSTIHDRN